MCKVQLEYSGAGVFTFRSHQAVVHLSQSGHNIKVEHAGREHFYRDVMYAFRQAYKFAGGELVPTGDLFTGTLTPPPGASSG